MDLSVVIVNYNVEYFLEQCLSSVEKAIEGIEAEVFVVDNNSVDDSLTMVSQRFPFVKVIANSENVGFSKANNQAIRLSKGRYVLLLNPDTIVENDTFTKVIEFMDSHLDAGGLGVKMLDGKGNFLPESKRGLPTPEVAFYKIFGLSKIFKNSKRFGKYHLTYLDNDKIHPIDVLSGAFMLLRSETLAKTGLLDEDYFMYGEDIDISYRITLAGYKNYYFPNTRIIHYKGESTKKSSLNYVFVFYKAMIIFARKHFSGKNAKLFAFIINIAIYLRASISIIKRFVGKIWLPITDFLLIFSSMFGLKLYWEETVLSLKSSHFPDEFLFIAIPIYIIIWILSVYIAEGYSKLPKPSKIVKGVIGGTIFILVFYALLPDSYRYSRAMIILGAASAITVMILWRIILNAFKIYKFRFGDEQSNRFLVVGMIGESKRVADLLQKTSLNPEFIGIITPEKIIDKDVVGTLNQISEIITIYKIKEVVFCAKDIPAHQIIDLMGRLQYLQIEFKIAPPESKSIIGSNSINTSGDIYVIQVNAITTHRNRRNKRILDILISLFAIIFSPILVIINYKPIQYYKNCFLVLFGVKSWVGTFPLTNSINNYAIKKSILYATDGINIKNINEELIEKINNIYCRDYKVTSDLRIIIKSLRNLGRK